MRRRDFITLIGGAAAMWPMAARAQQSVKLPTVAFLGTGTSGSQGQWAAAFVKHLGELGWSDTRTARIDIRWAEGRADRVVELATEFSNAGVDVIVTTGTAVADTMRATQQIPIVFAVAVDPIGSGFVANLARPGGNVTGLSTQSPDIAGKRIELLREAFPALHRLAAIANVGYPASIQELTEVKAACSRLGLELAATLEIRKGEDIEPAFKTLSRADALYIVSESLTNANRIRINTFARDAQLPTISAFREFVEAGGLMSYGPSFTHLFQRAAEYVDRILRGEKPADIPVEQPTKFDLVVNLTTAKALGLSIPESFLLRADEVIE